MKAQKCEPLSLFPISVTLNAGNKCFAKSLINRLQQLWFTVTDTGQKCIPSVRETPQICSQGSQQRGSSRELHAAASLESYSIIHCKKLMDNKTAPSAPVVKSFKSKGKHLMSDVSITLSWSKRQAIYCCHADLPLKTPSKPQLLLERKLSRTK